ncbi:hypothetical protein Rxycam_00484 [Rubrobacter xylanophilus DSM 9941]|uniref:hypothetical protein n=1 Tax=Rubrobacter xylanophilus TaxID=49319 RepID=UPI001C641471|nr:hypothetical protein [Rubrobacter xylanophilus]QYJ14682.1 hypothetical protein Rxycam_00484 [Rubrobacter xylanophilus DSM 9941]
MAPRTGVALLHSEPAGALPLRTAGVAGFVTKLSWRAGEAPRGALLPAAPGLPEGARLRFEETGCGEGVRWLRGEVRALERRTLGEALEAVLRAVMEAAALSGALAEVEVVRGAPPREGAARVLRRLRRDLRAAGFCAQEVPHCWSPVPDDAASWVGTGGREDLVSFLRGHPCWEVL